MSKGISDAQKAKETLWTDSDFKSGTIKSIRYMDRSNHYIGDKDNKSIPVYGQAEIEFDDGVTANIPCTIDEAQEYYIGQKASVELVTDDDDNESDE